MKLVDDWREAHKWISVRLASGGALLTAIATALAMSGSAVQWLGVIPLWAVFLLAFLIFVGIVIGRLWDQTPRTDDTDEAGA